MKPKILIIDDDATFLELMQDLLLDNFDIAVAEDVVAGSDLILTEPFDMLILDVRMPVINGLEYLEMLTARAGFAGLPVLVVSGERALQNQFKPGPTQAFLPKPFAGDELMEKINYLLSLRQPKAPSENN